MSPASSGSPKLPDPSAQWIPFPQLACLGGSPQIPCVFTQDIILLTQPTEGTEGFLKLSKPRTSREGSRFQAETNTGSQRSAHSLEGSAGEVMLGVGLREVTHDGEGK